MMGYEDTRGMGYEDTREEEQTVRRGNKRTISRKEETRNGNQGVMEYPMTEDQKGQRSIEILEDIATPETEVR